MKLSNIIKYLFILFVIGLIIFAVYKIYSNNKNSEKNNIVSESDLDEGIIKDLKIGVSSFDTINPLITKNKEIIKIDSLVFEPLFTITSSYELSNCLATEWSRTGDKIYLIKLNSTVKWHDGTYFTAKDVQFTIDRLKDGDSVYKANVQHVISVEVIDASTIKIYLDEEVPFFEYNLTFPIMNYMQYQDKDFYNNDEIPLGTGRFKISTINNNSIIFSKNTEWRKIAEDNSKIDTVKINIYSSMGEVFNSFKLSNIELINTTNFNYQEYVGTMGYTVTEVPGRSFDFLALNCNDSVLKDKYVRQAIMCALDKEKLISEVYGNTRQVSNYPLDYGNYLFNGADDNYSVDTEKARQILEENGWTYSKGRWYKKDEDYVTRYINLKLYVNENNYERNELAKKISDQLRVAGINVSVVKVSQDQYNDYLNNKDYQMIITGIYNSYSPNLNYFYGPNNISNYSNEEVTKILTSGISTKDREGIKEKYKNLYNIYKVDVPFIGLSRDKRLLLTSNSIQGKILSNNYSDFYNIGTWYRK